MSKQTITIMVGTPGTGKSTVASKIRKSRQDTLIVSKDSIRQMLYGDYDFIKVNESLIHELFIQNVVEIIRVGKDVILDNTHVTKKGRADLKAEILVWCFHEIGFTENDLNFDIIYCESDNPLENRMKDSRGVEVFQWQYIIDGMSKRLEVPTLEECSNLRIFKNLKEIEA